MTRNAITVENLSKAYRIGLKQERADSLIGLAQQTLTAPFRNFRQLRRLDTLAHQDDAPDLFWALKDVSFEIPEGEVLGVIGRNGAGKSTLLKVLSRITEPTAGLAVIRGRVASLLEVGTGFHPDLSGRDNIYMNGTILGMTKREIDRKLDQIVDFSGVEKFLDTPVKRYSSGMRVRLGFAVAAHLDPEILIVDEVLAVGDATFQNQCVTRMSVLAREGRTILFVSHNLDMIHRLCPRSLRLASGRLVADGKSSEIVRAYLQEDAQFSPTDDLSVHPRTGDGRATFVRACFLDRSGRETTQHVCGDRLTVRFEVSSNSEMRDVGIAIVLSAAGNRIVTSWNRETGCPIELIRGRQTIECEFESVALRPGHHLALDLWMEHGTVMDCVENCGSILGIAGELTQQLSTDQKQGPIAVPAVWRSTPMTSPSPPAV